MAQKVVKEIQIMKNWTEDYERMEGAMSDLETLHEFFTMGEVTEEEIKAEGKRVEQVIEEIELKKMLSNEEDQFSAIIEINSGAGGTESQDWASMLYRMYLMWPLEIARACLPRSRLYAWLAICRSSSRTDHPPRSASVS